MATSADYIEYVMDQLEAAHTGLDLWYGRFFGEYCIYAGAKPLLLVCDNTVLIKRLAPLKPLLADCDSGEPFPGAKDYAILDVDCNPRLGEIILLLNEVKPMPKPKKRRIKKRANN